MTKPVSVVMAALNQARNVSKTIGDSIASLRESIEDLKDQRQEIEDLPVEIAIAEKRAELWAHRRVAEARRQAGDPRYFTLSPKHLESSDQPFRDDGTLLLAYLGDAFVAAVKENVAEAYLHVPGISDAERAALLAANDSKILEAELAEEAIIRNAETQGFALERRENADPRAVLAHQDDLPC